MDKLQQQTGHGQTIARPRTMRSKLEEIRADLVSIERGGFFGQTAKLRRVVWNLWGLLELIVVQLERSAPDGGKAEGTDRHL